LARGAQAPMTDALPRKRSVTLDGHRTSFSLEPLFWRLLQEEAERQGKALAALVAEVDRRRAEDESGANLSSALRVYLVERLLERKPT
ncbi:MAG TPA: ribbon-helix-helix domain-containing protein, partial [Polyangiaceae bacterium]|nr:ribbon-helix-helix domain-containing protein [Polyangiaceae bacterium]